MALRPTEENKRKLLAISTFSRQMCWYVTKKSLTLELHLPLTSELFIFDARHQSRPECSVSSVPRQSRRPGRTDIWILVARHS